MHRNQARRGARRAWMPLAAAATLLTALAASAAPARFENGNLHYRFDAPDGWSRVPQEALDAEADSHRLARPLAAFQLSPPPLRAPMLLVSHRDEPGRGSAELNDELAHDPGTRIGQDGRVLVHDDKQGAVLLAERFRAGDGGMLRHVAALVPGRLGIVQLDFYLPDAGRPAYADPAVRDVLRTFAFEAGYEPEKIEPGTARAVIAEIKRKLRASPLLGVAIALGVLGLVAGVLRTRRA